MSRIEIPAALIEFESAGNTLWVQSPAGATILRIKSKGGFVLDQCQSNPVSHADLIVEGPIRICLSEDVKAL